MVTVVDEIVARAGEQVVDAQYLVPAFEEDADEVGAEETRAPGDENPAAGGIAALHLLCRSLALQRKLAIVDPSFALPLSRRLDARGLKAG
ncbi:hypothetical protein GCM10022211_25810 [Sphingomonas humi]|uniref:Uncharacterized protein n=1 Tax=Sphingomonas humi TaxID=335630 RepID=A0ABP7SD82_9SPHN